MEKILEITAIYFGSILTILTAGTTMLKTSNRFSRWLSTKIVNSAHISMASNCPVKPKLDGDIAKILQKLDDLSHIKLSIKRLEYLNMRQHNENDVVSINAIYDEYKKMGGNSYIDMDYEQWSKDRLKKAYVKKNKEK